MDTSLFRLKKYLPQTHLQHINGLAKKLPLEPILQLAEVLCRQLGACSDLPDDLKCLVVRPPPKRYTSIIEMETIVCSPEGSAVLSGNRTVPSVNWSVVDSYKEQTVPNDNQDVSSDNGVAPFMDRIVPSANTTTSVNYPSTTWPIQSGNGANPSAIQAIPVEDSLQSTTSCDDLIV